MREVSESGAILKRAKLRLRAKSFDSFREMLVSRHHLTTKAQRQRQRHSDNNDYDYLRFLPARHPPIRQSLGCGGRGARPANL